MRLRLILASVLAGAAFGCHERAEPTQAEKASPEERNLYRKQIDQRFIAEERTKIGTRPVVWVHEGRKVREAAPTRLVPVTPKLPPRQDVVRIEYKNGDDPFWVAQTPEEIDRIYQAALRESKAPQEPATARYFYPDGSSFEAPLEKDVFRHGCLMGLYFYGRGDLIYEISGHPGSFWLELRHSGEGHIHNPTVSAIVQEYCRRSPAYVKAHPDD